MTKLESTLVLGGARSGKSTFAETLIRESGLKSTYLATATAGDSEMQERITNHRVRRGEGWHTVEEPLALSETLARESKNTRAILVDCLTLWLSNIMLANHDYTVEAEKLAKWLRNAPYPVVLVSNEVGLGLVDEFHVVREASIVHVDGVAALRKIQDVVALEHVLRQEGEADAGAARRRGRGGQDECGGDCEKTGCRGHWKKPPHSRRTAIASIALGSDIA